MKRFALSSALALFLALGMFPLTASAQPLLVDDFNDNSINLNVWTPESSGVPTVIETNSRLEVTLPGTALGSYFFADVVMVKGMVGDFDAQVDYSLLNWPASNGVRMAMIAKPLTGYGAGIERISRGPGEPDGPGEKYDTDIGGIGTQVATADLSGTLRLTRVGSTIHGYYLSSGNWIEVGTNAWTDGQASLALSAWSHDYLYGHQDVQVAFDNFQINSGTLVPEPMSLSLLALGVVPILRRRK